MLCEQIILGLQIRKALLSISQDDEVLIAYNN